MYQYFHHLHKSNKPLKEEFFKPLSSPPCTVAQQVSLIWRCWYPHTWALLIQLPVHVPQKAMQGGPHVWYTATSTEFQAPALGVSHHAMEATKE